MQVEVDVKCMYTRFGVCGLSGFGDFTPFLFSFKMDKIFIRIMDGGQIKESAQKIHASRGQCEMHGNQFWWA